MKIKKLFLNSGQSLFELLIAIGISALIIVAIVSLVTNSVQNATFSKNSTLASEYAQSATEWLRGQRDNNIDNFISKTTTPSWCLTDPALSDASWNNTGACGATEYITNTTFVRQLDFVTSTLSGKTIYTASVSVKWTDAKGTHQADSVTNLTDWRQR